MTNVVVVSEDVALVEVGRYNRRELRDVEVAENRGRFE
jgi:hypothetical protein